MENNNVSADYMVNYGIANEFKKSLVDQIERVLMESDITLGVPIESRVKDLDSLMEKLERKEIDIEKVSDLDDLIGLRVILLFKRDLDLV
ncbi:TPA: RelA/SpoT domain-containing protein, partial [Raoultella ornithinolytica]|nr:RelA/SpoT domain-containing protein [Raoultella ornithinolytica]